VTGEAVLSISAILTICLAQVLRIFRWKLMVYKDGEISNQILSRSVGVAYIGNLILPFRLGELFRVFYLRRKQFGTLPVVLSVFLERLLDSILITLIFGVYFYTKKDSFQNYLIVSAITTLGFLLVFFLAIRPQQEKLKILSFFSEDIQSKLHDSIFQMYLVLRNLKFNIKAIVILSSLINLGIFGSVILFSKAINREPSKIVEILIFELSNSISLTMVKLASLSNNIVTVYLYLIAPILILLVPSYREIKNFKLNSSRTELDLIRNMVRPEIKTENNDRYFKDAVLKIASSGREGLSKILTETLQGEKLYEVLQGGGSGDQVFLVETDDGGKVRKSAPAARRNVLIEQNKWLAYYAKSLPVVRTSKSVITPNAAYYDMEYLGKESSVFNIMHSTTLESCKELFEQLLQKMKMGAKESLVQSTSQSYADVYESKIKNAFAIIERLQLSEFLTGLFENEGTTLPEMELNNLLAYLSRQPLPIDEKWITHGDLTVSNMLFNEGRIVLIDPNPIQPFSHPSVDFGKLLQSFKCGYEFNFKEPKIIENDGRIRMLQTRSLVYAEMEKFLYLWIEKNSKLENLHHSQIQLLLHLLRIIPYTENRNQLIWIIYQARVCFSGLSRL
jgi:hypothetical protein